MQKTAGHFYENEFQCNLDQRLLSLKRKSTMKTILFTLAVVISISCFSQTESTTELKTLIPINNLKEFTTHCKTNGIYVGGITKATVIRQAPVVFQGIEAGLYANENLKLGLYHSSTAYDVRFDSFFPFNQGENLKASIQQSGLSMQFLFFPEAPVHFSIPLILGAGNTRIDSEEVFVSWDWYDEEFYSTEEYMVERGYFLFAEPGLNVSLNLTKRIRMDLGGSYKFTAMKSLHNMSAQDLSGVNLNLGVSYNFFGPY